MKDLTLTTAKATFQEWRLHRSSRAEPIPDNLWAMATSLYPAYKRSVICRQLSLSGRQFKQHLEGGGNRLRESGFVLASSGKVQAHSELRSDIQLTIQGSSRSLTLCVDVQALSQVLPHLGALL